jgi:hypothetical protein
MEKIEKKEKKVYPSKKIYGQEYNKRNINVQLDRDLVNLLREKISPISLKDYLEGLIRSSL